MYSLKAPKEMVQIDRNYCPIDGKKNIRNGSISGVSGVTLPQHSQLKSILKR